MQQTQNQTKKITSSNDCYEELLKIVPQSELDRREFFFVLYLNRANFIIGYDLISLGGISSSVVDTQIILQKAILILATGMILCHNHPSGGLQPSSQDLDLTKNSNQHWNSLISNYRITSSLQMRRVIILLRMKGGCRFYNL
ncbi:MAG: JAB domain-containing protein [Saprospiraceae bacterium]|nr:JAB domain-containing protein [Saprospiraceae bacterium]